MSEQNEAYICNKLAVTVEPYCNELFSSWIFRLALANGIEPYYLHKFVTGNPNSWNLDLDVTHNEQIIQDYSIVTGYTDKRINQLLLHELLERLAARKTAKTNSRWLIPLNNRGRNLTALGGIPFCPSCLTEKQYFSQNWRLATTTVCLEHKIYLKECCQKCRSPVTLKHVFAAFKNNITDELLCICASCGFDLRKSVKRCIKRRSIDHNQFNAQVIKDGFINMKDKQIQYSHLYFEAILVLSCVLLFRDNGCKLYNYLKNQLQMDCRHCEIVTQNMRTIENIPLNSRDTALYMINYLLTSYPNNLADAINNSKTMPSILHMTRDYKPFWF
ncbi:MAG TPA: TniQ family protein [Aquella sp.]|nr:TniQ family protein [Aquella sp.]